ncbi:MAG: DinB family protein, partial [Marivirga sp.]|nr:DinB family protein [Marivirga sp.]
MRKPASAVGLLHNLKTLMKKFILLAAVLQFAVSAYSQETALWTEGDRKYLLDILTRSRDELIRETKDLTKEQWNFKESPERWSINHIVEHIAIWELLMTHDVSRMLSNGPQPEMLAKASADSIFQNFIMEEKQHIS